MKITFGAPGKKHAKVRFEYVDDSTVEVVAGRRRITVGLGEEKGFNRRKFITAVRKAASMARANKIRKLSLDFPRYPKLNLSDEETAELVATNLEMANFEFVAFKTPPKGGWVFIDEVKISSRKRLPKDVRDSFGMGLVIGEAVNRCRTLANSPAGNMTPTVLADNAERASKSKNLLVSVLGKHDFEELKMGGILGVSKGSSEDPKMIVMEYWGGGQDEKPIVLIGKGVTFDSGGLNLKPTDGIYEMHMDMSGGAAVIHTLALASRLKLKKNVVGIVPAVENMPSGEAYRPGDILKSMSGKTIEIINTDAEGRIILADALTYSKKYKPRLVVDVATLTGASVVALGQHASAVFTKDENLECLLRELGEKSGDYAWPLPLWDEFENFTKGTFADVANAAQSKYGGAISGAMFLYQFAKDLPCPWAHIDIAPRMTSVEGDNLAKGAAGAPVRLLIKLLERY